MGFRHLCFASCAFFASTLLAFSAFGATKLKTATGESVLIDATNMFKDTAKQITELSNGIKIVYGGQYISCDHAIINEAKQEIEATGNLVISSANTYVEGDSAILSYRDNTGVIINGFVKSGQVIFEGKVVRKLGPDVYEAEEARYTACTTCPTAWTFSGSQIHAEIGGYAYIKHSTLRIADFPIFWTPYLIVPLKSERQTGLLIPSFDYSSSGGFAPSIPFFWAPNRSQDALFTYKHYDLRGDKGLLNYRYVLSPQSFGEWNTGYIHDRVFEATYGSNANAQRWFHSYDHTYEMPEGFTQKTKINFVSDLRYPRDFPEELQGQGDPSLENRVSLTKNTERTHASIDVDYYINQLQALPTASNRDAVHRWPELRYSLIERPVSSSGPLSNLLFNFNANYVNFARDDYAFDDVTGSGDAKKIDVNRTATNAGVYDPGQDVIRTGQRLDLLPEISYPFRTGPIDILPAIQLRHTQYSFNVTPPPGSNFEVAPSRDYLRGKISFRTGFSRIYGNREEMLVAAQPLKNTSWIDIESRQEGDDNIMPPTPPKPNLFRHEIEPELTFAGVPYISQSQSPFFGESAQTPAFLDNQPVSDSDFIVTPGVPSRGIQFDYEDRVVNRNTATLALANRLVRKSWYNGSPTYKQIVALKVAQSYDMDEAQRTVGPKFPWSDISTTLDVRLDHVETNTLVRHFPYHNKTNTSSRVKVMNGSEFFQVSFVQNYLITQNIEEAYEGRAENVGLAAGFDTRYLTAAGGIDASPRTWRPLDFEPKSWSTFLNLKPPGNCWGIRFTFIQPIGSDPFFKVDFDYKFGGETPPPVAVN